jgi:agmatine/peptidylarginine deiminase
MPSPLKLILISLSKIKFVLNTIKSIKRGLYVFALIFTTSLFSQEVIPHYTTQEEKDLLSSYSFSRSTLTDPPVGEVRTMAEWEEVEYVVITWVPSFPNILRQIVEAAVEECKVIITTENEAFVSSYLSSNGVDLTNVIFMNEDWNSIWIRDYAGNTIYSDDVGERALVDWIYNRPRPDDDVMPSAHASLVGLPIYITNSGTNDLVNTGGNFMSDGLGNAFASELVLNENAPGNPFGVTPKTEAEVDAIMQNYMGIDRYVKMTPLPFDVINHIDMHMKLLDEETLLVSEYPEGVADGPQIEENLDYVLSNFMSAFGTPYKVKRISAPPSSSGLYPDQGGFYRNYTNAIFINKTILIPLYRPEVDEPALAQWEEMMPGYNIVGIDVDDPGENLISQVGAIHCITHTIGVSDPLWIVHKPIAEAAPSETVAVEAMIKHHSGVSSASVFWRTEGSTNYTEIPMSIDTEDMWTTNLSIPESDEEIEYYIKGTANSGKTINRPIVAPEGYWKINVDDVFSTESFTAQDIKGPYPNPTSGKVKFQLETKTDINAVSIYNILGQRLQHIKIEKDISVIELSLVDYEAGVYFIHFNASEWNITKKIIKN